ncbi:MAG TPA: phosphatase PAP2 family protein [Povalibacter sp.]|nr:phosphatase PAP2 family protein [Povalibacter sp.]
MHNHNESECPSARAQSIWTRPGHGAWAGCLLLVLGLVASARTQAGDLTASEVLEDTRLYFTAPLRWDSDNWLYFGASIVAVGAATQYDDDVRSHFIDGSHAAPAGQDPNSLEHALPAAALFAGTLTAAALVHSRDGYGESWSMLEAGALSGVTAVALKYASGRDRPNETDQVDAWFAGGDSFPSLHTTMAFAIGTVFAESGNDRYRWLRRSLGYGVAAGTAYLRLRDNVHWLSDTVAGAALGVASAQFVMNRHDLMRRHHAAVMLMPVEGGLMMSCSVPLH